MNNISVIEEIAIYLFARLGQTVGFWDDLDNNVKKYYRDIAKEIFYLTKEEEIMVSDILKYFSYQHLKDKELQDVSRKFHDLAYWIEKNLNENEEKVVALRKLLEAKDCAVRSML